MSPGRERAGAIRGTPTLAWPLTVTTSLNGGSPRTVEWVVAPGLVPYEAACAFMVERVRCDRGRHARPSWCGCSSIRRSTPPAPAPSAEDLLQPGRFPVHRTGRGGQFTYHGPGQRVVYVMLDVKRRFGDVRAYVHALEAWVIEALGELGVEGRTHRRAHRRLGAAAGNCRAGATTRSRRSACGCDAG